MMTGNAVGTLYSQLSPISFSEFTPSRVTRVSNNPYLQEHCPFSSSIVASGVPPNRPRRISSTTTPPPTSSNKYVELAFNGTEQTQLSDKDVSTETVEDCYSTIRRYQRPEGPFKTESVLGYTADSLDEEEQEAESKIIRQSLTSTSIHMDRPISFAIAIDENPISIFDIGSPTASTGHICGGLSQGDPHHEDDIVISSRTSSTTNRQPTEGQSLALPSSKDESSISIYRNVPVDIPHSLGGHPAAHANHSRVSTHFNDHVPALSPGNEYYNVVLSDHKAMPSYRRSSSDISHHDTTCSFSPSGDVFHSNIHHRVPPGDTNGDTNSCSMEDLLHHHHHKTIVKPRGSLGHSNSCSTSTPNLPQLLTSASSSSNEESYGRFTVVYLGKMATDCYTSCIDKCAQKMLDPKSTIPLHTSEVTVDVMSSRIRLMKPTSGMLLVSIPVNDIFTFSQCSKNKRLVGVIVWKRNTIVPVCHLFRCYDQLLSKAFLDSIASVKQDADCLLMEKLTQSNADCKPQSLLTSSLSDSSVGDDVLHKWLAVHVATVRLYNKSPISVSGIIKKAVSDYRPSQSNSVSLWASLAQVRLVQTVDKKQVIYGQHSVRSMEAIGTGQNDQRLIGYIIREKDKPPIAYVLLCYNLVDAGALVNFLRQACQNDYQLRKGSNLLPHDLTVEQGGSATGSSRKGLLSLFRSIKPIRSNNVSDTDESSSQSVSPLNVTSTSPNLSSSFQSYVSSQQISSSVVSDIPQKRKNCVNQPSPLQSSFDSPEDEFAKFSVTYVGSANLEGPFTSSSIAEALDKFKEGGVAVGMAPIAKNTVTMHVSALGINLSDKKQKMFINRNYPQKQIIGHCSLLSDPEYFGFATLRPGFKDQVKVHVFTSCDPSTDQILYTMKYWLNITTPHIYS